MAARQFISPVRIPFSAFLLVWILSLYLIAYGLAWAYAAMRATAGAGPQTAAKLGLVVGFAAGFPLNFAHGVFQAMDPAFYFWWGVQMMGGAILAALTAAWVYKD